MIIVETKSVFTFLEKRNLLNQYAKAKRYLKTGYSENVDFKIRKPKSNKFYSFRINKQYRAWCIFDEGVLKVFDINDHQ